MYTVFGFMAILFPALSCMADWNCTPTATHCDVHLPHMQRSRLLPQLCLAITDVSGPLQHQHQVFLIHDQCRVGTCQPCFCCMDWKAGA